MFRGKYGYLSRPISAPPLGGIASHGSTYSIVRISRTTVASLTVLCPATPQRLHMLNGKIARKQTDGYYMGWHYSSIVPFYGGCQGLF